MTDISEPNGLRWRVSELESWRREIEALRPDVQAEVLRRVEKKVDTLTRIAITLLVGLITSMIGLIAVLALGGGGKP